MVNAGLFLCWYVVWGVVLLLFSAVCWFGYSVGGGLYFLVFGVIFSCV